ncbi:AAA family ATPase [Tindallia californiensis]|uniref:Pilus assembly protein CpaE n=1 Tax=Tindallia californiensis TaxID=159292 RepID=A0A1H3M5X3_9FIRM|nr:P-loop NTPase [Tindallia californiensis]SDY72120.1 pilus assembly protein CpaE [Tindallia californiensis]
MAAKLMIFADAETSQHFHQMLSDEEFQIVSTTDDESQVLERITQTKPEIAIIASNQLGTTTRVAQQIYLLRPNVTPVVITKEYNYEVMQQVMQAGIHYILPFQADKEALVAQIKGIRSNEMSRLAALQHTASSNYKSRVITVCRSKGGVGATSMVINLATKLAQLKRRVAILDLDLEYGEVAYDMRLKPEKTIAELLEEQPTVNADNVRKYMATHTSGVSVLAAPDSPEFVENISSSQTEKIISVLRTYFDYIIIDTSIGFNSVNLSSFDLSSLVLFVTGMDLAALQRSKKGLSIVHSLIPSEKLKLVVAKEEIGRVKLKDVSKTLEYPVFSSIPYDQKVANEAVNQGRPAVMEAPSSKISEAYEILAGEIDSIGSEAVTSGEKEESQKKRGKKKGFFKR